LAPGVGIARVDSWAAWPDPEADRPDPEADRPDPEADRPDPEAAGPDPEVAVPAELVVGAAVETPAAPVWPEAVPHAASPSEATIAMPSRPVRFHVPRDPAIPAHHPFRERPSHPGR
jgi:hypothetical protein